MNKISETIVFFGSGPVAAASLAFLADHFTLEAVITKAAPPHHREPAPVEIIARERGLSLLFANTKAELDQLIDSQHLQSRLGIIVDYGVIVSQATIDAFELGIINSHFSLLPRWRGADPISFAILAGDDKTGVSLMLIEPTLDTGKILVQKSIKLEPTDTTPTLTAKLIDLSNQLLREYVPKYLAGTVTPRAQPHPDRVTYSRKLTKEDGIIDWTKPAEQIEREIRAHADWPKSRTELAGKEVIITQAHVGTDGPLTMPTGQGSLVIDKLKPAGKAQMTAADFIRGYLRSVHSPDQSGVQLDPSKTVDDEHAGSPDQA
jgi:methionyl-tRNA formyltransferase